MAEVKEKKFGEKYILLDLLGIGGMAEVYRSKLLGDQGFEKLIVIKKLLPQVAEDKEMVRLFIGEARLAALLQHENIAATYDFGEIDGNYFLAMEYLSGKDLYTILQRAREVGNPLPIKHALLIASKICEGMDYAHRLNDLEGNPLNITHRDLTPHNIFITNDGKIKVFDFGVAKAEILDNRTRVGVVKGKLSYMSPEQIGGENVDHRSDIFSIGILLYEMLSGQRMYSGDTATLIQKCITVDYEQLEDIVPDLQPELYAILHKALTRDPGSRYQSCSEMQTDIDDLMFIMAERQDAKGLQNYVRDLFAEEVESSREKEPSFGDTTVVFSTGYDKTLIRRAPSRRFTDVLKGYDKKFIITCSACFIAAIGILFFSFSSGDKESVSSGEVARKAVPHADSVTDTGASKQPPTPGEKRRQEQRARVAEIKLQHIGYSYADKAEAEFSAGRIADAEKLVGLGLSEAPGHDGLLELKTKIAAKKNAAIAELESKAAQRLAENKLTTPERDSAYYFYQEILKLDPENMQAKNGLQTIADRYVSLAEKAHMKFDMAGAQVYVHRGLKVMPEHPRLQELKEELSKNTVEKFFKGIEKNLDNVFSN